MAILTRKTLKKTTPEMDAMLRRTYNVADHIERSKAMRELALALALPLKQGVLKGDNIGGIYQPIAFAPGAAVEFPLDFLAPGTEKDHVAYTMPNSGKIPYRNVEGDYVMVPTYMVANSVNWLLKYARDARWDVVERAMQVLEGGFVRKNNDDGWHTIIAAAVGRSIVVYDDQAVAGLFTKRLVELSRVTMRRKAGGNATSVNRGKLTDVYMSPEALGDMRSWDLTQIDDFTRREIFLAGDGDTALTRVFGILVHDIDEMGVGQDYNTYFLAQGGSLPSGKLEMAIGLDLSKDDCFVQPIRQEVGVYEDPSMHRELSAGVYAFGEWGFTCLDSRRVLALAL